MKAKEYKKSNLFTLSQLELDLLVERILLDENLSPTALEIRIPRSETYLIGIGNEQIVITGPGIIECDDNTCNFYKDGSLEASFAISSLRESNTMGAHLLLNKIENARRQAGQAPIVSESSTPQPVEAASTNGAPINIPSGFSENYPDIGLNDGAAIITDNGTIRQEQGSREIYIESLLNSRVEPGDTTMSFLLAQINAALNTKYKIVDLTVVSGAETRVEENLVELPAPILEGGEGGESAYATEPQNSNLQQLWESIDTYLYTGIGLLIGIGSLFYWIKRATEKEKASITRRLQGGEKPQQVIRIGEEPDQELAAIQEENEKKRKFEHAYKVATRRDADDGRREVEGRKEAVVAYLKAKRVPRHNDAYLDFNDNIRTTDVGRRDHGHVDKYHEKDGTITIDGVTYRDGIEVEVTAANGNLRKLSEGWQDNPKS